MPIVDMPLNELKLFKGRTPCPKDNEQFWSDAVDEMNALAGEVQLIPSDFTCSFAKCFDLYFIGTKGARIHARYIKPNAPSTPHPAVLVFHGYSGRSGDFSEYLSYAACGFSVAAMDVRGQGGESQDVGGIIGNTLQGHITRGLSDVPHNLFYRDVFLDTALLTKIVAGFPEVDSTRMGTMGVSQGGALALACAALVPEIKRTVAICPFLCDYQRVWEMDMCAGAFEDLQLFFRKFDPQHLREPELFEKLGHIDIQHLAHRIRAKVLMLTGLMDTICPPSTQFAAYNKIQSEKSMLIFPDFTHEDYPGQRDETFLFLSLL